MLEVVLDEVLDDSSTSWRNGSLLLNDAESTESWPSRAGGASCAVNTGASDVLDTGVLGTGVPVVGDGVIVPVGDCAACANLLW